MRRDEGSAEPDGQGRDAVSLWLRCEKGLYRGEQCVVFGCIGLMFAMLVAQVISRYVVGHALVFSEELARLALVCGAFLGAALLAHDGKFIAVTFGPSHGVVARAMDLFASAVAVTGAVFVIIATSDLVPAHMRLSLPASGLPRGLMAGSALVGMTLVVVHVVARAMRAQRLVGPPELEGQGVG